jgi:hypothetical protein
VAPVGTVAMISVADTTVNAAATPLKLTLVALPTVVLTKIGVFGP